MITALVTFCSLSEHKSTRTVIMMASHPRRARTAAPTADTRLYRRYV
jgi:hypothetical protein